MMCHIFAGVLTHLYPKSIFIMTETKTNSYQVEKIINKISTQKSFYLSIYLCCYLVRTS